MRPPLALVLLTLFSGCRISAFREVRLPTEGPTFFVACNYELANCLRRAEEACGGNYEQVTRKNCPRCKKPVPLNVQTAPFVTPPNYRGTLYFRCMGRRHASH